MIDPDQITNFNATDEELEEVLLFWICVAGKSAKITSKNLDKLLKSLPIGSPFDKIRLVGFKNLSRLLKRFGIGCYNMKSKSMWEIVNSGLDLRTCSVDDLENIYGIGPKTSRCFLIHSRSNVNHAGLDTHVLKFLKSKGHNVPKSTPSSKKLYIKLEKLVLEYAKKSNQSIAEFDLNIWKYYADGGIQRMEEMITITRKEYDSLIKDSRWLRMLEMAGVDNWEGHDIAIDFYQEKYPEED